MAVKSSLTAIDFSGNLCTDVGALALSKMLQRNTQLRVVNLDGNAITLKGFNWVRDQNSSTFSILNPPRFVRVWRETVCLWISSRPLKTWRVSSTHWSI